ncbi:MAG: hypothetical protein WDZ82_01785 [Candidatus Paceibacterota bacterium]
MTNATDVHIVEGFQEVYNELCELDNARIIPHPTSRNVTYVGLKAAIQTIESERQTNLHIMTVNGEQWFSITGLSTEAVINILKKYNFEIEGPRAL